MSSASAAELLQQREEAATIRSFGVRSYAWLAGGLLLSCVFALPISEPTREWSLATMLLLPKLLFAIEFGSAAIIQKYVERMTELTATLVFLTFCALNGFICGILFRPISAGAVAYGFFCASVMFAVSSATAQWWNIDLLDLGGFGVLGGAGAALLVIGNFAMHSDRHHWATSYMAVVLFGAIALYHVSDLREWAIDTEYDDDENRRRTAIFGALTIYLDFVLLFLLTARLMQKSEQDKKS